MLITVEKADQLIASQFRRRPVERRDLADAAGCILRETIRADRDYPPYDRSTMDGIAVRHSSAQRWNVEQLARAGEPRKRLRAGSGCIEIMTGAVLPSGCDTVIPYEHLEIKNGSARALRSAQRGQFIHRRGQDRIRGEVLLEAGSLLTAPAIAVAASTGAKSVRVWASPSVAVISTGDEIVQLGRAALPHQIRPSNGYGMAAALRSAGCGSHMLLAPDDPRALERVLRRALHDHDWVIVSGGVSMGKADFVPATLKRLGVKTRFHGVSLRPGKPFLFGVGRAGQAVFAFPGNPVSSLVCFRRFLLPLVRPDRTEHAMLTRRMEFNPPLTLFLPVTVSAGADGKIRATPVPYSGSGDLAAAAASDGILELPRTRRSFPAGYVGRLWRW